MAEHIAAHVALKHAGGLRVGGLNGGVGVGAGGVLTEYAKQRAANDKAAGYAGDAGGEKPTFWPGPFVSKASLASNSSICTAARFFGQP